MQVFADIEKLRSYLSWKKSQGVSFGFAPTMGALHQGHVSLLAEAHQRGYASICSIFVNPTQFNEVSDLQKYPRVLREDLTLLESVDCDVAFIPEVSAIYPEHLDTQVTMDLDGLDEGMEGNHRPGHFAGMLQVVNRLLDIVEPSAIFMGQKDYQQYALVRHMCATLHPSTEVVMCPIIREDSGLAMSSRNRRLSDEWKQKATIISASLASAKKNILSHSIEDLRQNALEAMSKEGLKPEYFDIVDGKTLRSVEDARAHDSIVACTAAWAGDVRLIDNMILL